MVYYHGTDAESLNAILKNGVDITRGSGELGQGFYVGSSLWRAFSWAWIKTNGNGIRKKYGVIQCTFKDEDFLSLKVLCKNRYSTLGTYRYLKKNHWECTWVFGCDAIWSPIVGKNVQNAYQIKFEGEKGKFFVNKKMKMKEWKRKK